LEGYAVFVEQLVKRRKGPKEWAIRIAVIFAALAVCAAAFIFLGAFALVAPIAAGFGVYYILASLNVEYEYCLTNDELDIDCIYNKARRKRKYSCSIRNAEIFCRADDQTSLARFTRAKRVKDFSSGAGKPNTYAFIINDAKIIIEPDERFLEAVKKYLTPRVFIA
jgi:hypothetical protein